MKTKTLLYMALAAVMATLAACSQDDDMQQDAAPVATPIEFEITDGGYGGNDATRAVEEGYYTKFTASDECGLYIVNGTTLKATNVKLTLTASGENSESSELTWRPQNGTEIDVADGDMYFLYYPYQNDNDMANKIDVNNTAKDTDFFGQLISGWEVKDNQSDHKDYTASDLMTAKGTATNDGTTLKLSFKLAHRMALAEIIAPVEVRFTSNSYKPYKVEDFKYRFIVNPGTVADGKYIKGSIGEKRFTITAGRLNLLNKEQYKTFKVGTYYVETTPEGEHIYHVYDYKGLMAWAAAGDGYSCKLEADITMPEPENGNTYNWTPADVNPMCIFDGNGHTITGLRVNNTNHAGFISQNHGTVKNLTLMDAHVTGTHNAGGVVGLNDNGIIENCHVAEDCSVYGDPAGGIAGSSYEGTVTGCYALCSLTGKDKCTLGGIIGYFMDNGSLTACYSNCSSYTNGSMTGGIVGNVARGTPTFTACYYDNRNKGVSSGDGVDDTTIKVDGTTGKTWADAVEGMNKALNAAGYTGYKYEIPAGGTLPIMVKN